MSSKTGIPVDVLPARGLTSRQAERMSRIDGSDLPRVATQARNKEESTEERKARKQLIRDERKVSNTRAEVIGLLVPRAAPVDSCARLTPCWFGLR